MRIRRPILLGLLALFVSAGVVLAVPVKLASTPLARGTWDRADRTEFLAALAAQGRLDQSDVFIVRATLGPADATDTRPGMTDWHRHTGPSVVVVTQGTLTALMPTPAGGCMTHIYGPGQSFFHTAGPHNFVNNGTSVVEFYVAYFVPAGPPLIAADDPGTC